MSSFLGCCWCGGRPHYTMSAGFMYVRKYLALEVALYWTDFPRRYEDCRCAGW